MNANTAYAWPTSDPAHVAMEAIRHLATRADLSVDERIEHLNQVLFFGEDVLDRLTEGETA